MWTFNLLWNWHLTTLQVVNFLLHPSSFNEESHFVPDTASDRLNIRLNISFMRCFARGYDVEDSEGLVQLFAAQAVLINLLQLYIKSDLLFKFIF